MKYAIREIKPLSFARITSIAAAILSALGSIPYIIVVFFVGFGYSGFEVMMLFWILAIIVIAYIVGLIFGLLFAVIYNWIAGASKGIELEIDIAQQEENKN